MTKYNGSSFEPPAPIASITLQHPRTNSKIRGVQVQLDSGADMTCLPRAEIEKFKNLLYSSVKAKGALGNSSILKSYVINIVFRGHLFRNISVIPIEEKVGYLGRDILNEVRILLDGPGLEWSNIKKSKRQI